MKILLTNFHYGRGGGHDTYIGTIAKALAARHQIFVAAPASSRLFEHASALENVTALPLDFPAKLKEAASMFAAWRALRSLLQSENFDVVHVNGSPDHRLLMFCLLHFKGPRPRVVLTKHNSIVIKRDFLTRLRATRATDDVIAVSDATAELVRNSVYRHCTLTVIKNGVDVDAFTPPQVADATAARVHLLGESKAGRLVIGTVTGFDSYKGTMDMIAAAAALPPALRNQITLVIVGREPSVEQIQAIDSMGMQDQVDIVGFVEDVKPYIRIFDIGFVMSYAIETVSFACREMMAMGKPVIVSRYSGLPENVDVGVNGWIVPPHDPVSLSVALSAIITQRHRLEKMGVQARIKAVREFTQADFVDGTEAIYRLSQSSSHSREAQAIDLTVLPRDSFPTPPGEL